MSAGDNLTLMRHKFPEVQFRMQNEPSYVRMHLASMNINESESPRQIIAFGSLKDNAEAVETPKKRDQTTLTSEFELTGSPLKLDMAYDKMDDTFLMDVSTLWSQEETRDECVLYKEASRVIDYYNTMYGANFDSADECVQLWVICDAQNTAKSVLLSAQSYKGHFERVIVETMETVNAADLCIGDLRAKHLTIFGCFSAQVFTYLVEAMYRISGRKTKSPEVINKNHNGMTQLECKWPIATLRIPAQDTTVNLQQEIIVGHELSLCSPILWRSVCAIQGISNAVINLSSLENASSIANISIRPFNPLWKGPNREKLESDLQELLNEVEAYGELPSGQRGGCIFISDDCTTIESALTQLLYVGSSHDFTYKLWDILRDCDTVEDLITILVTALKSIFERNLRPYVSIDTGEFIILMEQVHNVENLELQLEICNIDPANTTFLGGLVKKLARGLSQHAVKSISTLFNNPIKALNIIGQLGIAKTSWEYTNIFAMVDSTLAFNDKLKLQNRMPEVDEDANNQTMLEVTLGSGDVTVNPFDARFNLTDSTFVQEATDTPIMTGELADLTLMDFASLKVHNIELKTDGTSWKDQPLFSDEVNVELSSKEWKYKTMRLAQLHVCLEHMLRAQMSLNLDFNALKPITTQLLDFYLSEKSPVKTVDQMHNEPIQFIATPLAYKTVKEHLECKNPNLYRISFKSDSHDNGIYVKGSEPSQTVKSTFVCSQQPVFPPNIVAPKVNEHQEAVDSVQYYRSHYIFLSNKMSQP